jgi:hypothetical protein
LNSSSLASAKADVLYWAGAELARCRINDVRTIVVVAVVTRVYGITPLKFLSVKPDKTGISAMIIAV